jgi:hypothetical protein
LVDRRKQAKVQWLQDPAVVNEDDLNNVRREASIQFRNKRREYFTGKLNDLEAHFFPINFTFTILNSAYDISQAN